MTECLTIQVESTDPRVAQAFKAMNDLPQHDPLRYECEAQMYAVLYRAACRKSEECRQSA